MKSLACQRTILFLLLLAAAGMHRPAEAADKENCLMCHRYISMARIDEDGRVRNFHVDEHVFFNSLHGEVECRGCHKTIRKFPHDPQDEPVSCANECHIQPPFAEKHFAHGKIVEQYDKSAHAIEADDRPLLQKSKPQCTYCHVNPLYQRMDPDEVDFGKTLDRCLNCHPEEGVEGAYLHIAHRLRQKTSRSSQKIVELCSARCHGDEHLMKRLDLSEVGVTAVETYNKSIHGKMTALGSNESADCISCHASSRLHDIYEEDNPESTVNPDNLLSMCENCHDRVNRYFVQIAVHPSVEAEEHPFLFVLSNLVLRSMLYGTVFGLMGLLVLETYRRKRNGIRMKLKGGTSWERLEKTKKSEGGQGGSYLDQ